MVIGLSIAPPGSRRAVVTGQSVEYQPGIPGFNYVRPLGSGGFARVYLYEQDMPRRVVAIKVLNKVAQTREVFEREADAMARLSSHPSIVSIFEAGISLEGHPYLAMEYCPASMGALTKRRPAQLRDVLDTGVRMAGALETAHRTGVLHRDIKPANVLLTTLGRPVLSDFGIAQIIGDPEVDAEQVAMSVPWSAPEIVRLEDRGGIGSEVWSLGATLYSFAAGFAPFEAHQREQNTRTKMIARIGKAQYRSIPGAQGYGPLDEVLARALQRNPNDRFASTVEFGEALQALQRGYGYDVTPLEVIATPWLPDVGTLETRASRGPVVSTVPGRRSRAEERAAHLAGQRVEDTRGLKRDRPLSSARSALLGAGVALASAAAIGAALWAVLGSGH